MILRGLDIFREKLGVIFNARLVVDWDEIAVLVKFEESGGVVFDVVDKKNAVEVVNFME